MKTYQVMINPDWPNSPDHQPYGPITPYEEEAWKWLDEYVNSHYKFPKEKTLRGWQVDYGYDVKYPTGKFNYRTLGYIDCLQDTFNNNKSNLLTHIEQLKSKIKGIQQDIDLIKETIEELNYVE